MSWPFDSLYLLVAVVAVVVVVITVNNKSFLRRIADLPILEKNKLLFKIVFISKWRHSLCHKALLWLYGWHVHDMTWHVYKGVYGCVKKRTRVDGPSKRTHAANMTCVYVWQRLQPPVPLSDDTLIIIRHSNSTVCLKKTGPLQLISLNFTNSQCSLIIFVIEIPHSILHWLR